MPFEILRDVAQWRCLHCYVKNIFVKSFAITLEEFLFQLPHNTFGRNLAAVFSLDAICSMCILIWLVLIFNQAYDKRFRNPPPPLEKKPVRVRVRSMGVFKESFSGTIKKTNLANENKEFEISSSCITGQKFSLVDKVTKYNNGSHYKQGVLENICKLQENPLDRCFYDALTV